MARYRGQHLNEYMYIYKMQVQRTDVFHIGSTVKETWDVRKTYDALPTFYNHAQSVQKKPFLHSAGWCNALCPLMRELARPSNSHEQNTNQSIQIPSYLQLRAQQMHSERNEWTLNTLLQMENWAYRSVLSSFTTNGIYVYFLSGF